MSLSPIVVRCRLCGAPLKNPTTYIVTCSYCEADNVLEDFAPNRASVEIQERVDAARIAAQQVEEMIPEIERRSLELQTRMTAAIVEMRTTTVPAIRSAARAEAIRLFEAFFRLNQMPGLMIAGALGPLGEEMFVRVDKATTKAVLQFTEGIDDYWVR